MKLEITNLVDLSSAIGSRIDYVQGGGGNISVKISPNLMAIKASGYELKNLNKNNGFAFVDHKKITETINDAIDDETFSYKIKSLTKILEGYPNLRPSMETGFHSLVKFKYVIHTHSVYANILACAHEGKKHAAEIFPESWFLEYYNPGLGVTSAINKDLHNYPRLQKAQIIFLQNHGLIVAANSKDEAFSLHEEVNYKIQNYYKLNKFNPVEQKLAEENFMKKNILFPDQIVFCLYEEMSKSQIAFHIFAAYSYILENIKNSGLTPFFLTQKNVDFVANMESEKYRQEIAKK